MQSPAHQTLDHAPRVSAMTERVREFKRYWKCVGNGRMRAEDVIKRVQFNIIEAAFKFIPF